MATAAPAGRRSIARAVMGALPEWSLRHDAERRYLHVERDAAAARALYAAAGFTRSHGYHLRIAR